MGIVGRWSHFHSSTSISADNPAQTDPNTTTTIYSAAPLGVGFAAASSQGVDNQLGFDSALSMDVTDLEIIRDWKFGRGSLWFGAGVRYAYLNQTYNANWNSIPQDPTLDTVATNLTSGHHFSGIGPLVSLDARLPVGNSGLSLLATGRGAILLGTGSQNASMTSTEVDQFGNLVNQSLTSQVQSSGGTIPMLEFELGGEWGIPMGRSDFVIQAAFVGQAWFCAGNAANQDSIFNSTMPSNNVNNQQTLGMLGLRLTAGLTY